ncbi:MAG: sigma-70 family RNA polymerase sigma factor [Pseudomonadota bacterium]
MIDAIPKLRRFAYALTGAPGDADDLVQETIEKALRRLSTYKEGSAMQSWLFKIMQNTFIDSQRARQRRPEHVSIDETGATFADMKQGASEDAVFLKQVRTAISGLPEGQRIVVAHVLIAGHTYKEAAELLDLPVGTVMSRLNRARRTLQTQLLGGENSYV